MRDATPLDVAVISLAAFRLTRLITRDDLPPIAAARDAILDWAGKGSTISEGLQCPWCVGFWISLATVAFGMRSPRNRRVLLPLAVSGIVGLLASADSALSQAGRL